MSRARLTGVGVVLLGCSRLTLSSVITWSLLNFIRIEYQSLLPFLIAHKIIIDLFNAHPFIPSLIYLFNHSFNYLFLHSFFFTHSNRFMKMEIHLVLRLQILNKPDRTTMRPDCVSACNEHVIWTERQMDELTDETTEK